MIKAKAICGAIIVFGVLFYQIRRKFVAKQKKDQEKSKDVAIEGSSDKTKALV